MIDLLRTRRSIRRFEDRPLSTGQRALLEEALLRAPSSRNRMPWRYVMVEEEATRQALARCKPVGVAWLAQAPLNVVICGDPAATDVWVEDCAIAAIILQLEAHAIGLGSCWGQVRNRRHDDSRSASDYVLALLDLPRDLEVLAVMGVGHPAETKPGWPEDGLNHDRIIRHRS